MSAQNNNSPPPPSPSFDQIVKGDVCITKLKNKKNMYRITFSKIGKFLMYQVWDKDNTLNRNSRRNVFRLPAKEWVNYFIQLNKDLKEKGKELFTPTTIMETTSEEQYVFVIRKIHFNSHGRVVFTISTKEIQLSNNCSKKLIQIPCGKFYNMRFDIDFIEDYSVYIDSVPQGTTNDPNVKCWTDDQLDWRQSRVLGVKLFSSKETPRGIPPGPGMRNSTSDLDSQYWYAYPCSSY
jgi:hypothetical protein